MIDVKNIIKNLQKTKMWSFIQDAEDIIGIMVVGSSLIKDLQDDKSDIDILCLTKNRTIKSPYSITYNNIIIHGDYLSIGEYITAQRLHDIERLKGHQLGLILLFDYTPQFIYVHPRFSGLKTGILIHKNKLAKIGTYKSYYYYGNSFYVPDGSGEYTKKKDFSYMLLATYYFQNKSVNYNLVYKVKRFQPLNSIELQEMESQIKWLYEYIDQHPINFYQDELILFNDLVHKYMEAEGIHENKPDI